MENGQLATKVVTGKVRLSYAHIWTPSAIDGGQDPKYSVSIIIPKTDTKTISKIKQAIENAKQTGITKFGGKIPTSLKIPLTDGDEKRPDDEAYADSYYINCTSRTKPNIVDRNCNPILAQEEVYSGCYGAVSINFYAFNTNGNKGIAAGLNNIMKLSDGEPLGGRVSAEADFADFDLSEYEEDLLG